MERKELKEEMADYCEDFEERMRDCRLSCKWMKGSCRNSSSFPSLSLSAKLIQDKRCSQEQVQGYFEILKYKFVQINKRRTAITRAFFFLQNSNSNFSHPYYVYIFLIILCQIYVVCLFVLNLTKQLTTKINKVFQSKLFFIFIMSN